MFATHLFASLLMHIPVNKLVLSMRHKQYSNLSFLSLYGSSNQTGKNWTAKTDVFNFYSISLQIQKYYDCTCLITCSH